MNLVGLEVRRHCGLVVRVAALTLLTTFAACSSSSATNTGAGNDDETKASQQNTDVGGSGLVTLQQAMVASDTMFAFDPLVAPDGTPEQNTTAIKGHVETTAASCAKITASLRSLTIDYGAGCVINGITLTGSVGISLSKTALGGVGDKAGTTTLAVTFTGFTANTVSLSGTASFATTTGSTFDVTLDLTSGATSVTGTIKVVGAPSTMTIDGPLSITTGELKASATLKGVVHTKNTCYVGAGTSTVQVAPLPASVSTFSTNTASSGKYTTVTGRKTSTDQFKPYGSCPSSDAGP